MGAKTTGAEWNAFYQDAEFWPEGRWHEEEEVTLNGHPVGEDFAFEAAMDTDVLVVSGGVVFDEDVVGDLCSLEALFKRWKKKQSTVRIVMEVPKEKEQEFRESMKSGGWKIL